MTEFCRNKLQDIIRHVSDGGDAAADVFPMPSSADLTIIQSGRQWVSLPPDISDKILLYLGDPDMCGYLTKIAKTNCFLPSETVYKFLCERIYPIQTSKKSLSVEIWGGWKGMLVNRPRIRTNGFYCLRTLHTRAPCNDAFWEEKKTQSIEVMHYRYMRFFDNGRVLYTLSTVDPQIMEKALRRGIPEHKKLFMGKFWIAKRSVTVEVEMHYCTMFFKLQLLDAPVEDGWSGKHNILKLVSHSYIPLQLSTAVDNVVVMKIPERPDFQFWRQWNWF